MFKIYFVLNVSIHVDHDMIQLLVGNFFMVCLYVELNFAIDEEI